MGFTAPLNTGWPELNKTLQPYPSSEINRPMSCLKTNWPMSRLYLSWPMSCLSVLANVVPQLSWSMSCLSVWPMSRLSKLASHCQVNKSQKEMEQAFKPKLNHRGRVYRIGSCHGDMTLFDDRSCARRMKREGIHSQIIYSSTNQDEAWTTKMTRGSSNWMYDRTMNTDCLWEHIGDESFA